MRPDFGYTDDLIRQGIRQEVFPSACLLIGQGEKVMFRRAYGRLSPEGERTNEHTRYDIASITKPLVTGMLTLRALEQGRLCLWDKLGMFVQAPQDKQEITIEQLLTHTAGLPAGLHLWKEGTPEDAAERMLAVPLLAPPGMRVQYCCEGYILLGLLLECLYDLPLEELARREVFEPLGMENTSFCPQGDNIAATEAQPDGTLLTGIVHDENARFFGGTAGNAGVFSTMDDIALFVQMLAAKGRLPDGRQYLSPSTLRVAMKNHTSEMSQGRGLGFYLPWYDDGYTGDLFPRETIGHTGFTGTSFALDITTGFYVILLTNRVCPSRNNTAIFRIRRLVHNTARACIPE